MKALLLGILVTVSAIGPAVATNGQEISRVFEEGNTAFKNEDFAEAIKKYSYLVDSLKITSNVLWYNLGNSYYRAGQLGKALVAFERALKLAPRDQDIINNIEFIRFQTKDKITAKRSFILFRWVRELYQSFSLAELVWTTEVIYLLIIILVCIILLKRDWLGWLKHILVTLAAVLLICSAFLSTKICRSKYVKHAVILDPKVDVYSGPAEKYTLRFILHEGARLRLYKQSEGWYLIELENRERGWVRQESLEII